MALRGGRRQIDVGRRPGLADDLTVNSRRRDDRHVASRIETPEPGIDHEEPDGHHPDVMRRNIPRRSIRCELAQARPEHHQDAERITAGNGVNDPRSISVVVTQDLHHPAAVVPAPGGIDDPEDRSDQHCMNPERAGADPLDHGPGDNRSRGPGKQQERGPEYTG